MKVSILNQCHPEHDSARLRRLRALHDGGPAFRAVAGDLIPKGACEPLDVYEERKALACYVNHAGPIATVLASALFAEAPQVSGLEGDWYASFLQDCDRQSSTWSAFWQYRLEDAEIGRDAWVWVNLPARDAIERSSLADEQSSGDLDAYLVALDAEAVLDWGEDAFGRVTWVLVRDIVDARMGPTEPRQRTWRWTSIDATQIRRWIWTPSQDRKEPLPDDEATEQPPVLHNMGYLPVVRLRLPPALWTMSKAEDAAVAALRSRNEHSWALHQAANELLVIRSKWGDGKPVLGHGYYLRLQRDADGEDSAEYVAPSGVAFQYLQADVKDTREEVYRIVQQMALSADSDASTARNSGESKAQDWRALDIVLGTYRSIVLQAMKATLQVVLQARGDTAPSLSLSGLDGWHNEDVTTWLSAAALATDAREASPTFRRIVARREAERLLQDEATPEELEAIRAEIDGWEPAPAVFVPSQPGQDDTSEETDGAGEE